LIADKPRHGYEIIKAVEELVEGAYSPSPGVIYPTLTLLEELDWIRAIASEGNKRLYEITPDGSLALKANKSIVEAIFARMAEVTEAHAGEGADGKKACGDTAMAPRLRVALDDLTRAVEQQTAAGPLTNEQVGTIVSALANAAGEVEGVRSQ
jgi:DNA-binding PadR family transcriptional regulator